MLWHPLLRPAIKGTGHVQKFGHNSQLLPCPIWVGKFYHYQNKNSSIQKILNVSQREERGTEERRETNASSV